jgi:hypothetical protein
MREVGAVHARAGELELHLGPPPSWPVAPSPQASSADDEDPLQALLRPIGLDPDIFRGKVA